MTICFRRSSRLVMTFPVRILTVSFVMAAEPQAAGEEETRLGNFS